MKNFLRKPKGGAQPEDEDRNRGALFGNRTTAAPPPPYGASGNGYASNATTNPYAPERGGDRGGYGAPQGEYGRSNSEAGNRGGYGGASNPYALQRGGDNDRYDSPNDPGREQLFGARKQVYGGDSGHPHGQYPNEPSTEDDDAEETKKMIKREKDKTVGSLNNALRAAEMAEESGRATVGRLGAQGERLSNTEKNLDVASTQNRIAEDKARELKRANRSMFAPSMGNPFHSSARAKEEEAKILARHQSDREERERTREFGYDGRSSVGRALNDTGRVESRATTSLAERSRYQFEADESDDEKEKAIADGLDQLGAITGRLKGLAMATSAEVDRQNVQIERIMKKSDRVDDQIAINHNRIRKIH
ncbi:hypothetical protein HOY80DRAFT_1012444 [Tuber brumale]|nr:hypothetical protein HOY80DRAFT_1012444 [Tuber brumale]